MAAEEKSTSQDQVREARRRATADYNSVVDAAEIQSIRLISSNFECKAEYSLERTKELSGKVKLNRQFGGAHQFGGYSEGLLFGSFSWKLTTKKGRKNLLNASAEFVVVFRSIPAVESAIAKRFLRHVGRFAVYPYFRTFVSQMTGMANADVPILPMLKQPVASSPSTEEAPDE